MRFTLGTVIEILWCGMLKLYSPTTIFPCIVLVFLFLGLPGCKVVQTIDGFNGILEEPMPPSEAGKILHAEYAFYEGNYDLAEKSFFDRSRRQRYAALPQSGTLRSGLYRYCHS